MILIYNVKNNTPNSLFTSTYTNIRTAQRVAPRTGPGGYEGRGSMCRIHEGTVAIIY